jgi:hypothetical protein
MYLLQTALGLFRYLKSHNTHCKLASGAIIDLNVDSQYIAISILWALTIPILKDGAYECIMTCSVPCVTMCGDMPVPKVFS